MTTGRNVSAYRAAALALALMLGAYPWTGAAAANASGASWGIEALMQRLAQVKTAKGQFVERKHLRILDAPLELTGTLVYSAPGRLEKHTLTPRPERMVLDQDRLTIEDGKRKQRRTLALHDYPVLWAFVESIRSTLAGDLQSLNRFYRVELEGDEREWRLLLRPREGRMQAIVSEIRIGGSQQSVRTIEVVEAGGDYSLMTITEDKR